MSIGCDAETVRLSEMFQHNQHFSVGFLFFLLSSFVVQAAGCLLPFSYFLAAK
jgi:hypothetical protein